MADDPAVVERGVLTAAAERWDLAVRRAEVIGQLARQSMVGLAAAEAAAAELGVSRRRVYVLIGRWRAGKALHRICCLASPAEAVVADGSRMR
jgi:putative transposase